MQKMTLIKRMDFQFANQFQSGIPAIYNSIIKQYEGENTNHHFLKLVIIFQNFFSLLQSFASLLLFVSAINASPVSKPEAEAQGYNRGPRPVPVPAPLKVGPAKPYSFAYEVIDPLGDANFGHRESSDGVVTEGEYRVVLPDGRTQIVTYTASDATGYVADVRYEGTINPDAFASVPVPVAVPAPVVPVPEPVPVVGLAPRGFVKRNENTKTDDFEASPKAEESKPAQLPKKQYKKLQAPHRHSPRPKYYVPAQQPF